MGEPFCWLNADKVEYIDPVDFDFGYKSTESSFRGNVFLCALRELISTDWKGDHLVFLGDDKKIPEDTQNETLRLVSQIRGSGVNFIDVSGQFKAAEESVHIEILMYLDCIKDGIFIPDNDYGVDTSKPFDGLFTRNGRDFRYTLNHTKKLCYSLDDTEILFMNDRMSSKDFDPLPLLMAYGRTVNTGLWLGDIIGVSDEIPKGYELLKQIKIYG